MRYAYLILFLLPTAFGSQAQNVGIGTAAPTQKLDVNGAVKIGYTTANVQAGTIRWNATKQDFEGYNGERWVSFSGGRSVWGNTEQYATENNGITGLKTDTLFGATLSLFDDRLATGAAKATANNLVNAGRALVYSLHNSGDSYFTSSFASPAPGANFGFGTSVSLFDNALAVGEPGATVNGNSRQGRAYIYRLEDNNVPVLHDALEQTAADGDPFDGFGSTVSLASKDVVAVGAPDKTIGGNSKQGRVYIFRRTYVLGQPSPSFAQEAGFTAPDGNADMRFGAAVSLQPTCIAVGAPGGMYSGEAVGKVYIFRRVAGLWQYEATLNAPQAVGGAEFGAAVSLSPAGDTCVVGWPGLGGVMVYRKTGNGWTGGVSVAGLGGAYSRGSAVAYRNGEILVGQKFAQVGINDRQGKAQLYANNGNTWQQVAVFTPQSGEKNLLFGSAVQLGDGKLVVGAAGYHSPLTRTEAGRIYYFDKDE